MLLGNVVKIMSLFSGMYGVWRFLTVRKFALLLYLYGVLIFSFDFITTNSPIIATSTLHIVYVSLMLSDKYAWRLLTLIC
jgi:hypothetical protein